MTKVAQVVNVSNSTSILNFSLTDFKPFEIRNVDILFGVLYSVIVCLGLVGNILVVAVVRKTPSMHTTTNYLLVNLAIADIITLLWNPRTYSFAFYPIHPKGITGDYICKVFTGNAVISIAIGASVFTLTTVAVERYHALVKPLKAEKLRIQAETVKYAITVIWVLAFLINMPDFIVVHFDEHYRRCICPYSLEAVSSLRVHVLCTVIFLGVLPFLVLGFCYLQIIRGIFFQKTIIGQSQGEEDEKAKKKLAKLLLSVTVAFYSCYLPYGVFISFLALSKRQDLVKKQDSYIVWLKLVEFLVTCSSFLNPILYAFQSSNYREGFLKITRLNSLTFCQNPLRLFFRNRKIHDNVELFKSAANAPVSDRNGLSLYRVSAASVFTLLEQNYQTVGTSNVSFQFESNENLPSINKTGHNDLKQSDSRTTTAWADRN